MTNPWLIKANFCLFCSFNRFFGVLQARLGVLRGRVDTSHKYFGSASSASVASKRPLFDVAGFSHRQLSALGLHSAGRGSMQPDLGC
jgi:hypothetical protein